MKKLYTLIFFFVAINYVWSAPSDSIAAVEQYELALLDARDYNKLSLFADCVNRIDYAIELAEENAWEEKVILAKIFLAEIKRRIGDFDEGITILESLDSEKYPYLHVKKLDRIVALTNEMVDHESESDHRTLIYRYLDSAIIISKRHNYENLLAGLYNQLGYTIGRDDEDSCIYYLNMAANLFWKSKDIQNYIGAKTNIIRSYEHNGDSLKVMEIFNEIKPLLVDKGWYTAERELYYIISKLYKKKKNIEQSYFWRIKSFKSEINNLKNLGTKQLDSYRALYETKKYQKKVKEKETLLKTEEKKSRELRFYLLSIIILSLLIGFFLLRERKLKKGVNLLNEKYHMLIVESNHRIKNNLQMIISMLQYSTKDLEEKNSLAFKRMSGKIQTISALHKHLYLDVHNELVDMRTYFKDILTLYEELSSGQFKIEVDIKNVQINSERIVYFGLIFNEMLTNTFEHSNAEKKNIVIKVEDREDRFRFIYQDNSSFEITNQKGTGITLIEQLVKRVGGSSFKVDGSVGQYQFEFYV